MDKELVDLIGKEKYDVFIKMKDNINLLYNMDQTFNSGGKRWNYEYKFRKSCKTLCTFYFKKSTLVIMIIFGKNERDKVEEVRNTISKEIIKEYDDAKTYHDGKWVSFELNDMSNYKDIEKLLLIKRKSNKKKEVVYGKNK